MYLKSLELSGFKSFGKKETLEFTAPITAIVGPNGSGKSNSAEAFRFVLGEQSMKSLRGKRGEDLIWGGSSVLPRSNRASVKLVFDNTKHLLNIDFDEVVLERTVYRDGTNEYATNGSRVRLKDITELLAGANIGSSGHHIISQGEADRVLAASPKERRQMVEDALGLRVYQYKKEESRRKLTKTNENIAQIEALRREVAPHVKFLEKQVQKLERARELRAKLVTHYHEYLKREELYLAQCKEEVEGARRIPESELRSTSARLSSVRHALEAARKDDAASASVLSLERELTQARDDVAAQVRILGRLEGQVAFEQRRLDDEEKRAREGDGKPVPYRSVRELWEDLTSLFSQAGDAVPDLKRVIADAQARLKQFTDRFQSQHEGYEPDRRELERLIQEQTHAEDRLERARAQVQGLEGRVSEMKVTIEQGRDENRELEHEMFTLMARETALHSELSLLESRRLTFERETEEFKRELTEAIALIGREARGYTEVILAGTMDLDVGDGEDRALQLGRRRELEKLKIRLEEMGGASADEITKEYNDAKERDAFLARELDDLARTAEALSALIAQLDHDLAEKFDVGVALVSKQFNDFFALMFGGGGASLRVTTPPKRTVLAKMFEGDALPEEDEDPEQAGAEGLEVEVTLPKKRVQSLVMLSGGERALTSIALIFAMSQVNPPPFLILDETDAALDEANSRRYGDMIESLATKSQLILITHNRETMSRAGVLYGVTMGADGVSKLLSVKLDEAVAVAK